MLSSDVPSGSVVNGLEMGKLVNGEEVVIETQVRNGEEGGVWRRGGGWRVRGHLALALWVVRVGRGSGRSRSPRCLHLFHFHHERSDGAEWDEATVEKKRDANQNKRCHPSFPLSFLSFFNINFIGRNLEERWYWMNPISLIALQLLLEILCSMMYAYQNPPRRCGLHEQRELLRNFWLRKKMSWEWRTTVWHSGNLAQPN